MNYKIILLFTILLLSCQSTPKEDKVADFANRIESIIRADDLKSFVAEFSPDKATIALFEESQEDAVGEQEYSYRESSVQWFEDLKKLGIPAGAHIHPIDWTAFRVVQSTYNLSKMRDREYGSIGLEFEYDLTTCILTFPDVRKLKMGQWKIFDKATIACANAPHDHEH